MSKNGTVAGDINGLHKEAEVLWKIPNYFSTQRADFFYESPSFHFSGSSWKLRIYPNGMRKCQSVEFVGLYVQRETEDEKLPVFFKMRIVGDDEQLPERKEFFKDDITTFFGWDRFVSRQILVKLKPVIAPEDTLTIKFVGLPAGHNAAAGTQTTRDGISALSQDFQTLFSSEEKSDFAIKVKSRLFRVHSLILGARSIVFSAMCKHKMKEKNPVLVNIVECDPASFQEFLLFVYTGNIDNLSSENVIDIFTLANEYALSDLMQICIDFMEENLNIYVVCDVLSIADKFNVVSLEQSARKFIVKNMKNVMPTENWINFLRENPELATEILMSAMNLNINVHLPLGSCDESLLYEKKNFIV